MKQRMLTAILAALLLLSGCSQPIMSPATSSEQTSTQAKSGTDTASSNAAAYPTDDLNLPRVAVELVKAIDGDTISVMFEGKRKTFGCC